MTPQAAPWCALAALAASPAFALLAHAALCRLLPGRPAQLVALAACAAGAPLTLGVVLLGGGLAGGASAAAYGALVYGALAYAYFHWFNLSETARRVRILHEVAREPGIAEEELSRRYPAETLLELRLRRLVELGAARLEGGRYVLASVPLRVAAAALEAWAKVLGLAAR